MSETAQKLIIAHGQRSRSDYRRWSDEQKRQIVAETYVPGTSISIVARRHDVNANQLFQWRKKFAGQSGILKEAGLVPIHVISRRHDNDAAPRARNSVIGRSSWASPAIGSRS